MPNLGSIIVGSGSTPTWNELYAGATGECLCMSSGGVPAWTSYLATGIHIGDTAIYSERIELNTNGSGNRYAYIDFHGDDTYTDYSFRIIRGNGGVNTVSQLQHRGTGDFNLIAEDAGNIAFLTANTTRGYFGAAGHFYTSTSNYIYLGGQGTYYWRYYSSYTALHTNAHLMTDGALLAAGNLYLSYPSNASYYFYWSGANTAYRTNANVWGSSLFTDAWIYFTNQGGNSPPSGGSGGIYGGYNVYTGVNDLVFDFNGTDYKVTMTSLSMRKYKTNIKEMSGLLPTILKLKPSTYHFKDTRFDRDELGLVAEEVDELFPVIIDRMRKKDQDAFELYLNYDRVAVLAIQGLKEQQEIIVELEKRIGKLEKQ